MTLSKYAQGAILLFVFGLLAFGNFLRSIPPDAGGGFWFGGLAVLALIWGGSYYLYLKDRLLKADADNSD